MAENKAEQLSSINVEDLYAGREQLVKEYSQLREELMQRFDQLTVLQEILAHEISATAEPSADAAAVAADSGEAASQPVSHTRAAKTSPSLGEKFLRLRNKYDLEFLYAQSGALGSFAAGGGVSGLMAHPEKFMANLGFNVAAGVGVAGVERLVNWMVYRHKRKQAEREE